MIETISLTMRSKTRKKGKEKKIFETKKKKKK